MRYSRQVSLRLSDEELAALKRAAMKARMPATTYIREAIREKTDRDAKERKEAA